MLDAFTLVIDGDRVYWNVRIPRGALAIQLAEGRYLHLVVEVDDPVEVADRIVLALQQVERRDESAG
jgi:hypothetical protein